MFEPEIKHLEPETVAYLPMNGDFGQIPEGFGRLYGWIAQRGLTPVGMPRAVYLTKPAPGSAKAMKWEIVSPLADDPAPAVPDAAGVGIRLDPARRVAATMHKGSYDSIEPTYIALSNWIVEQGMTVAGPPEEIYYSDPKDTAPEDYLTEVRFPIA